MKKLVYLAALLGVAAGSFAFLPKESTNPQIGTITLIRNPNTYNHCEILTALNGEPKSEDVKFKGSEGDRKKACFQLINTHLTAAKAAGWSIITSDSQYYGNTGTETVYVLEKN